MNNQLNQELFGSESRQIMGQPEAEQLHLQAFIFPSQISPSVWDSLTFKETDRLPVVIWHNSPAIGIGTPEHKHLVDLLETNGYTDVTTQPHLSLVLSRGKLININTNELSIAASHLGHKILTMIPAEYLSSPVYMSFGSKKLNLNTNLVEIACFTPQQFAKELAFLTKSGYKDYKVEESPTNRSHKIITFLLK
jgi:hypothetical protein